MFRVWFSIALAALLFTECAKKESTTVTATSASSSSATSSSATSSTQATASTAAAKSTCSYITEAEASEALGQPSKYRTTEGTSSNCIIDPASGQGLSVDFTVDKNTGSFDYLSKEKGSETVTGVGDQAVWSGATEQLAAVKGGSELFLTIGDLSGGKADLKPKAVAFAQKVLAKF